jgi:hypothetical protein
MNGDVVVCIGENSIGIGQEMARTTSLSHNSTSLYHHQYIYAHDQCESSKWSRKQDSFQFVQKAYRWQDAYENGNAITDCLLAKIENCDSPRTMTLIYDASTALGSGLSKYLTHFITTSFPGLTISNVGILPHLHRGGFSGLHTVMAIESALSHHSHCFLRCLNDSEYLLDSSGIFSQCIGLESLYSATASDLIPLLSDSFLLHSFTDTSPSLLPLPISTNTGPFRSVNLLDIRSSQWVSSLQRFIPKKNKSRTSEESVTQAARNSEKILRHLSMNLHSLHLSSLLLSQTSKSNSSHRSLLSVSRATFFTSQPLSGDRNREASLTDFSRLNTVLQGATPGVIWPGTIPHHSTREESKDLKEFAQEMAMAALCFASPYADHLLKVSYQDAVASRKVGAFQRCNPLTSHTFHLMLLSSS